MTSARPPKAPTGSPPPITLPKQREVGRDAEALPARRRGRARKPVITSSKTSSAPDAVALVAQSLAGSRAPARRGPCWRRRVRRSRRRRRRRARARRCTGATMRVGAPRRRSRRPSRAARASATPLPPCGEQQRRRGRGSCRRTSRPSDGPVNPRATRMADIVASVPLDTRRTRSTLGTRSQIASASSTSRSVGAPYVVPSSGRRCTASTTAGCAWPSDDRAVATARSRCSACPRRPRRTALGPSDEVRRATDRAERPHRRVRRHRGSRCCAAREQLRRSWTRRVTRASRPASRAKYVRMMSAPARLIAVTCSSATARPSIQPFAAAALTIAYSPDTWYAATGTSTSAAHRAMTSRYASAGFTITMSAPSAMSSRISSSASRALRQSCW